MRNVYLYPKFHFLRHVTTRQARRRASRDVLSCVLRRACSSMADDEEAVLVVTDVSRFLRSSWHAVSRLLYSTRDGVTQHVRLFPRPKCMG